jgi:hypothetical protein
MNATVTDIFMDEAKQLREKLEINKTDLFFLTDCAKADNVNGFTNKILELCIKQGVDFPQNLSNLITDELADQTKTAMYSFLLGYNSERAN